MKKTRKLAPYFLTTGNYSLDERRDMCKKINRLGGVLLDVKHFPPNSECIVLCKKVYRSEKFLAACAAGMWVLYPIYIHDSYQEQRWLDPATYDIGKYIKHQGDDKLLAEAEAPSRWRAMRQTTGHGPFSSWTAVLLIRDRQKSEVYTRLLECGGAMVLSHEAIIGNKFSHDTLIATHAFVDESGQHSNEELLNRLQKYHVKCYDPRYIGEYLMSPQSASRYVIVRSPSVEVGRELPQDSLNTRATATTCSRQNKKCYLAAKEGKRKYLGGQTKLELTPTNSSSGPMTTKDSASDEHGASDTSMPLSNHSSASSSMESLMQSLQTCRVVVKRLADDEPDDLANTSLKKFKLEPEVDDDPGEPFRGVELEETFTDEHFPCDAHVKQEQLSPLVNSKGDSGFRLNPLLDHSYVVAGVSSSKSKKKEVKRNIFEGISRYCDPPIKLSDDEDFESPSFYDTDGSPVANNSRTNALGSQRSKMDSVGAKPASSSSYCLSPLCHVLQCQETDDVKASQNNVGKTPSVTNMHCTQAAKPVDNSETARNLENHADVESNVAEEWLTSKEGTDPPRVLDDGETTERSVFKGRVVKAKSRNCQKQSLLVVKSESLMEKDTTFSSQMMPVEKPNELLPISHSILSMVHDADHDPLHVVKFFSSCVATRRYPTPDALHKVLSYVNKNTNKSLVIAQQAYNVLFRVLNLFERHDADINLVKHVFVGSLNNDVNDIKSNWSYLYRLMSEILDHDLEDRSGLEMNMMLLRYIRHGLCVHYKILGRQMARNNCAETGHVKSMRCHRSLLAEWLWDDYLSSVSSSQLRQMFQILVRAIQSSLHPYQVELIDTVQCLTDMAAECCRQHHMAGKQLTCETIWNAVTPGTKLSVFCSMLVNQLSDLSQFTEAQLELAVTSFTGNWLALNVCRSLLDCFMQTEQQSALQYAASDSGVNNNSTAILSFSALVMSYMNINSSTLMKLSRSTAAKSTNSVPSTFSTPSKSRATKTAVPVGARKNVNKKNGKGETALYVACKKNDLATVKSLLSVADIDINCPDNAGWTPLHEACIQGHLDIVNELIMYRPRRTIDSYFSPGKVAASKKLNLSAANVDGITPLHDAVSNGHIKVAKLLVSHGGPSLLDIPDKCGRTPRAGATAEMKQILESALTLSESKQPNVTAVDSKSTTTCQSARLCDDETEVSAQGIHRYLILLVEFVKRAILLKENAPCTSDTTSDTDSSQLTSCTDQLRAKLSNLRVNGLHAEHELLIDKLEVLCMCL